ncbi:hypothetical protein [Pedobacter sp. KLB.chiD]|uniref:hypothetical protein n=1 Tax=Pedobacter sp. KLB.chiD TaxID=3387402 RepID=UPI00399A128D
MKKYIIPTVLFLLPFFASAQLPATRVINFTLRTVEDGLILAPPKGKYNPVTDSLDKVLKKSPKDTTALLYRSLLYYSYNQMLAAPAQRTKGTLENLTIAKDMIELAIKEKILDSRAKLLRAQIYSELCFRFSGDESWMFSATQIASRKKLFNTYKLAANKYYDELAMADKNHAYEYSKKKVGYNYPL